MKRNRSTSAKNYITFQHFWDGRVLSLNFPIRNGDRLFATGIFVSDDQTRIYQTLKNPPGAGVQIHQKIAVVFKNFRFSVCFRVPRFRYHFLPVSKLFDPCDVGIGRCWFCFTLKMEKWPRSASSSESRNLVYADCQSHLYSDYDLKNRITAKPPSALLKIAVKSSRVTWTPEVTNISSGFLKPQKKKMTVYLNTQLEGPRKGQARKQVRQPIMNCRLKTWSKSPTSETFPKSFSVTNRIAFKNQFSWQKKRD